MQDVCYIFVHWGIESVSNFVVSLVLLDLHLMKT